jgi:flagellar basal body-associated protein FliL
MDFTLIIILMIVALILLAGVAIYRLFFRKKEPEKELE